jgi:hypothetical protein
MSSSTASSGSEERRNSQEQPEGADVADETSQEPQSVTQQFLAEAIARREMGLEGLNAVRPHLLCLFAENERLHYQINRAFGGQSFNLDLSPTCPANLRRFKAYMECHNQEIQLLGKLVELWMLTCGFQTIRSPAPVKRGRSKR